MPGDYSPWHCLSRRLAFSWLKLAHAPAGATTLIVSLGVIARFFHLLVLEIAVALLWVQAILFNRLVGVSYPIWAGKIDSAMEEVINVHGRQRL